MQLCTFSRENWKQVELLQKALLCCYVGFLPQVQDKGVWRAVCSGYQDEE